MRRGVENLFGIGLLHRHYDLAPNEKIVELGPVSSPRIVGDDEEITSTHLACTRRALKPIEFRFVPLSEISSTTPTVFLAAFAEDIIQALQMTGLHNVLAINLVERNT